MDVTVLIPTHGRPAKLAACITALARQTLARERYEVLVGVDGPDDGAAAAARQAWGAGAGLTVVQCEKMGQAAVRNRLLAAARGRTLVFLNDDMVPEPGLLASHLGHQRAQEDAGRPAMIVGDSPWRVHEPDQLFDRLVRETSMIFFYDKMRDGPPDRDWGFRHAWMLNLSAPAAAVREAGGISVFPSTYGYEDDELAYRLGQRLGMPVLFRPDAVAVHDHRMDPADYLKRERALGFAAWGFAGRAPQCAAAMFGRDVRSREEIEYSRMFVARERATAERLAASFESLAHIPAAAVSGEHVGTIVRMLYEQHLLLKRWWWRTGLLEAADSPALDSAGAAVLKSASPPRPEPVGS